VVHGAAARVETGEAGVDSCRGGGDGRGPRIRLALVAQNIIHAKVLVGNRGGGELVVKNKKIVSHKSDMGYIFDHLKGLKKKKG
jgi:hypothetical protein